MSTRMIQRKGTYQQWFDANPTLNSGEIGFESDTGKFKIGDGNTNWNDLTYFVDEDQVTIMTQGYATEEYVDNAVSGVEVDLSTAAGNALDWNAGTSQLDVNVTSVINAIPSGTFAVPGDIPSLTGYATESYVTTAVNNVIDSAPGALNTLNELAAAINDDASYASTITTALGTKAPLQSPTFTGTVDFSGATVNGIPAATGKVVQIVRGSTTNIVTASINSNTPVSTGLSATITPTSASNKVLVFVNQNGIKKSPGGTEDFSLTFRVMRGSTQVGSFGGATTHTQSSGGGGGDAGGTFIDSPATTSALTYSVNAGRTISNSNGIDQSAFIIFQWLSAESTILLMEVQP